MCQYTGSEHTVDEQQSPDDVLDFDVMLMVEIEDDNPRRKEDAHFILLSSTAEQPQDGVITL